MSSATGYDTVEKTTKNNKEKAKFCTGYDTVGKTTKKATFCHRVRYSKQSNKKIQKITKGRQIFASGQMQSAEISRRIAVFCRGGLREWTGVLDRKPPQGKARQDKRESAAPGIVNKSITLKKNKENEKKVY